MHPVDALVHLAIAPVAAFHRMSVIHDIIEEALVATIIDRGKHAEGAIIPFIGGHCPYGTASLSFARNSFRNLVILGSMIATQ
jgi:hypothetical protein